MAKKFDEGYIETDGVLASTVAELDTIYSQAYTELKAKADRYMRQFAVDDARRRKLVENGKMTREEYQRWRRTQIMANRQFEAVMNTAADNLTHVNEIAYSVINGYIPMVYAINGNFTFYEIESHYGINTGFSLYNEQAVERLVREKPNLLPRARLDIPKSLQWNKSKINSAVIQGIVQGETIDTIAERLAGVADMNRNVSVRNAATMTTSAQNGGRLDSMSRAKGMGIDLGKRWVATLDGHTRDSHRHIDGEVRGIDELFSNGLLYPGDPNGAPKEVCNCRCVIIAAFEDSEFDGVKGRFSRLPEDMTYEEWKHAKGGEPFFKEANNTNTANFIDNKSKSGIIKEKDEMAVKEVHYIGKIDIEKYRAVTNGKILTDEVIITDNRIQHIIERRGKEFYNEYKGFFSEIIRDPDYIFKDNMENTALVSKTFKQKNNTVNIVLRLVVEGDNPQFKNSIITAVKEGDKRFSQRLRNNTPIYKKA